MKFWLILILIGLTACAQRPLTAQQRYAVLASLSEPSSFSIPVAAARPVYSGTMSSQLGSFEPNYQIRTAPAPSPARTLFDCGQTSSCAGAFDPRR